MNKRGITVYDLQKFFKFKQVAGNNESLGRPIFVQQVNLQFLYWFFYKVQNPQMLSILRVE